MMITAKLVPLVIDRDLAIRDFNALLGAPVALIGLTHEMFDADGVTFVPTQFFAHDVNHALTAKIFFSRKQWQKILRNVDTWSDDEQAAAHAIIFFMSHEATTFEGTFSRTKKTRSTWANFSYRLQSEGYFGESRLAQAKDREALLEQTAKKLDKTAKELKAE